MLLLKRIEIILVFLFVVGVSLGTAKAQSQTADMSMQGWGLQPLLYNAAIERGVIKGEVAGNELHAENALLVFYKARDNRPLWLDDNYSKIGAILPVLEKSWTHGLNPEKYHISKIYELLENPFLARKGQLELLVSDAVARYGRDLSGMRIDPASINQKAEYWRMPKDSLEILHMAAASDDVAGMLESLAPQGQLYEKLRDELVRLTREEGDYDHLLPIELNDHHFEPGERANAVNKIRQRLGFTNSGVTYDDDLAAAVMDFQRKHGLDADGIIGPKTLALLNRGKKDRVEQVVANLERMRWLDQEKPERYILVNIPSQRLWAIENGKVAHDMPVVVGMPWRRTKNFKTEVTGVRFNPTWTVPLSLKMQDFLPKLKKDPSYLAEKDIEVIRGYGRDAITLDPTAIDWHSTTWSEMGKLRFVQGPGDHNALGRIRILMPNQYNIYLHDTNHKELFVRGDRTLSSGCIRLARPHDIASFILGRNQNWSDDMMQPIIDTGETTEINSDSTLPVYIVYQSIWFDDNGELVYGPDVYKRDKELIEVLAENSDYYLPRKGERLYASVHNATRLALAE